FGAANADTVANFATSWDNIQLDAAAFANIGAGGRFAAGDVRFYAAPGATAGHDADDRIVYNSSTGQLFYDADGSGPGAAQLIATIPNLTPLGPTDIWVFRNAAPAGTINGTSGDDWLVGGAGNDTINGFGGNDMLRGAASADQMNGGDGNDTLDGNNSPGFSSTDPDVDTMDGGLGNDFYYVDNASDVLIDAGGVDTVVARNVVWTLAPGFENLSVQFSDQGGVGIGNDGDNVMSGSF